MALVLGLGLGLGLKDAVLHRSLSNDRGAAYSNLQKVCFWILERRRFRIDGAEIRTPYFSGGIVFPVHMQEDELTDRPARVEKDYVGDTSFRPYSDERKERKNPSTSP